MKPAVWLPHPLLSAVLLGIWLLLQNSLAPGQILLGGTLALTISGLMTRLCPKAIRLRRPGLAWRYLGRLLRDIVIANLEVASLILTRPMATIRPGFIELPLELENESAIAVLAATITLTPGTISVEVMADPHRLRIHCLDAADEATLIALLKSRYEAPLKEIFDPC